MNAFEIKTKTDNGRIAHTLVFMPREDIVVIRQRILANIEDLKNGWFFKGIPIYKFNDRVIVEVELTVWKSSFDMIREAVEKLKNT